MGRFTEADSLFQRALLIREKVLAPENLEIAETLEAHARLLHDVGRSAEAEAKEDRAKAIREKLKRSREAN